MVNSSFRHEIIIENNENHASKTWDETDVSSQRKLVQFIVLKTLSQANVYPNFADHEKVTNCYGWVFFFHRFTYTKLKIGSDCFKQSCFRGNTVHLIKNRKQMAIIYIVEYEMRFSTKYISTICFLFLIKLRWPKKMRSYELRRCFSPNSSQPSTHHHHHYY